MTFVLLCRRTLRETGICSGNRLSTGTMGHAGQGGASGAELKPSPKETKPSSKETKLSPKDTNASNYTMSFRIPRNQVSSAICYQESTI